MIFDPDESVSIRLTGSSVPNAGRIEVLYSGIWEQSVDPTGILMTLQWLAGSLVTKLVQKLALTNRLFMVRSAVLCWLTNLHCSGSEINLMSCSHDVIGNKSESERRGYIASVDLQ
ncbi:lysyl oxidase-like 4 [Desmophyllum pertusum]|uniref:Lysyl oxidase-like 4 n=1 Tax=Desmophyllum pertusum TaxID=174260 RepID=A0A9W9ZJB9_9CNID|nr:lysyl oxidase-like 4 [Desmophyllum pertusum]